MRRIGQISFFVFLFSLGLFLLPGITQASQNSSLPGSLDCTITALNGPSCLGQTIIRGVTGQAFHAQGSATGSGPYRFVLCLSTTQAANNGLCAYFNADTGNNFLNANDETQYRWGSVAWDAAFYSNAGNWHADLSVTGRVVSVTGDSANPSTIDAGDSSIITYSSTDAWDTGVNADDGACSGRPAFTGFFDGGISGSGFIYNYTTVPTCSGTSHFQAAARGPDANAKPTWVYAPNLNVIIKQVPIVDIKCNGINGPCTVPYNGSATLSWTTSNAVSCWGDWPVANTGKTRNTPPTEVVSNITNTTTYTLTCSNANGQKSDSVTVQNPPGPTAVLKCSTINGAYVAGPCTIATNAAAWLKWNISAGGDATTSCETVQGSLWSDGTPPHSRPSLPPQTEQTIPMTIGTATLGMHCRNSNTGWGNTDTVILNRTNTAPTTSAVNVTEASYCSQNRNVITVSWAYNDPEADAQSAYRVQVLDSATSTVIDDSTKISGTDTSYTFPSSQGGVDWNIRYYAQVKTWDALDLGSGWTIMSQCTGPGCAANKLTWKTPLHQYPRTVTINFAPPVPQLNQPINFSTGATCYNNAGATVACTSWAWNFGDGATSTAAAPNHAYAVNGNYTTTLQATDAAGYICPVPPAQQNFTFGIPSPSPTAAIPFWKEILPH